MKTFFALVVTSFLALALAPGAALADEPVEAGPRRTIDAEPSEPDPLVERSPLRKNIGKSLTAVGIVNMTAGAGVMLGLWFGGGGFGGLFGAIIGGPIHFEGTVLMGVGVPLWVEGSELVPEKEPAPQASPVPEVGVGPGSGTVTWSF